MSLSCSCGEDSFDYSDYPWFWMDYKHVTMPVGIRKRCCSCKNLIDISSEAIGFSRFRNVKTDIEERIYDEFVPLASWFMCESCSGLFLALEELGYCSSLGDDMRDLVAEHNAAQED